MVGIIDRQNVTTSQPQADQGRVQPQPWTLQSTPPSRLQAARASRSASSRLSPRPYTTVLRPAATAAQLFQKSTTTWQSSACARQFFSASVSAAGASAKS